jgi:hypothetical protein
MDTTRDLVGLCAQCVYVRRVETRRGSEFILCGRNATAPDVFPRYPRLPVHACDGYVPQDPLPAPRRG